MNTIALLFRTAPKVRKNLFKYNATPDVGFGALHGTGRR